MPNGGGGGGGGAPAYNAVLNKAKLNNKLSLFKPLVFEWGE